MRRRKERSWPIIKRTANDFNGRLGSLYNACHDQIVGTLNLNCDDPSENFPFQTQCTILKGDRHRHPSQLINIDEQLRLSLLLNLTSKNGLTAILDHPYAIDQYTRIIRYTYLYREEHFPNELSVIREVAPMITSETEATHIIISVSWGIDIVTILQLPSDDRIAAEIDRTLEKYRSYLNGERNDFKRTREDIDVMTKILGSQTYSNIIGIDRTIGFHDLFHQISRFKIDERNHQPLTYTLRSLPTLYRAFPSKNIAHFENYLLTLSNSMQMLEICFNENMQHLLCGHFKERFAHVYRQWLAIKQEYPSALTQYAQLVLEIRSSQIHMSTLEKKLRNKMNTTMKRTIDDLIRDVFDLNAKGHLISDLYHQRIRYCDAREYQIGKEDNDASLKRKLITDETIDRVLCSSDLLNRENSILFRQLRHNLVEERDNNNNLRLIYVDFSYCDYPLSRMMILPNKINQPKIKIKRKAPVKISRIQTLNILLLGATGLDKSTFLNALISYLTFPTLDKFQSHQPILNQFNISDNQHCQSYMYYLNENLKLRIIDTPGFTETQDSDQNERTIQHILHYIQKLTKLDAVCCLLKSNESPSNTFLRSYLTDLFDFLGSNLHNNLIFCSTDISSISSQEKNMFSFNNQTFHYLTALQDNIPISIDEEQNYEAYWTNSVAESYRLIDYVHNQLHPYPIPNDYELIKHLRIKIVNLTHPMIEAMRYILRNIVINKMNSLKPPIGPSTDLDQHVYQHLPQRPIVLEFLQEYQITDSPLNEKQDDMIDHLSLFCYLSAEFSDFLMHRADYRNGNPFLTGLHRLIGEEYDICEKQNRNYLNLQFVDSLKKLTSHFEQHIQTIQSNSKPTSLISIDQWVKYVSNYPLISGYVIDSARINQ